MLKYTVTMRHGVRILLAALSTIATTCTATPQTDSVRCATPETCIDGILTKARAGDHVGELLLMEQLDALRTTLPVGSTYQPQKEQFSGKELVEEIKRALRYTPTKAQLWLFLSAALDAESDTEQAASALVVAYDWTPNQKALLEQYQQQAQRDDKSAQVYNHALRVIQANAAAISQLETQLPPLPTEPGPPKIPFAKMDFRHCKKPEWPRSALRAKRTGTVTLAYFVDAEGQVIRAKILSSSGHSDLDHAALIGLSRCPIIPAEQDGKPFASWLKLLYVWTLE